MNQPAGLAPPDPAPSTAQRMAELRRWLFRLKSSSYDVSNECNLTCEGCLYFARPAGQRREKGTDAAAWDRLFAQEAARGINFVYLAGAEPSLALPSVRAAARHIPRGVVFTNGTRKIPRDIPYRLHISLWGLGEHSAELRGADVTAKALRNYRDDPRVVFVFTVTAENIHEIHPAAGLCRDHGVVLTYNYFSPTLEYGRYLDGQAGQDNQYFRLRDQGPTLRHDNASFARARAEIARAQAEFPKTVRYSMHYNDWITQPLSSLMTFDAEGIAVDCGNRLTDWHRHYEADATTSSEKCCSPNVDCRECRGYAMGLATYFKSFLRFRNDPGELANWLDGLAIWADLFLPRDGDRPAILGARA
ncbi:MAG: hypothetical protein KDK24_05090 [Pseudooceanicola sp.]|nr:hypothetical protein [Pseudooceanicola sp.]